MLTRSGILAAILLAAVSQRAWAQYVVIDDPNHVRGNRAARTWEPLQGPSTESLPPACGLFPTVKEGELVPGEGYLYFPLGAVEVGMNSVGQSVFYAAVYSAISHRNQGIVVKDAAGLHPIAIGCGGYLGSGDPGTACGDSSPIGGTFTGFYPSNIPPSINDAGDVLFLADVFGGSARRGLFLYRKAEGKIVKVAAIGDHTPAGVLAAVGNGSLSNNGEVAFLAGPGPSNLEMAVLHWRDGVIRKVVAPGDQVPGGTVFSLVWLGDLPPDGTYVPWGEVPDINSAGAISFYAILDSGVGLYVSRGGVHELYVITGQPSPVGGEYFNLYAPILNEVGEIAFFGEYSLDPWLAGWFVGKPGKWRKVVSFYDRIEGGQAWGLAVSHNPAQPLDDEGNLIVWSDVLLDDGTSIDTVSIGYADGAFETIARTGDLLLPSGRTLRRMNVWPTLETRRCGFGASLETGVRWQIEALRRPMEVTGLEVGAPEAGSGTSKVTWNPPMAPGAGALVHDVLRGVLGGFQKPATCAINDLSGTSWPEPAMGCPDAPGEGCWYLVRAEDSCGQGPYDASGTVCMDPCDGGLVPGCPGCGNGSIEGTEECDGTTHAGETCVTQGYDGGTLACGADCTWDLSGCTTVCGDGRIRGNEECEGTNVRGRRCSDLGFDGGRLVCSPACTLDLSACCCTDGTPGCPVCPECGNGVREAPFELCDGADTGPETCFSQGRPAGVLGCHSSCAAFDYSGCIGF